MRRLEYTGSHGYGGEKEMGSWHELVGAAWREAHREAQGSARTMNDMSSASRVTRLEVFLYDSTSLQWRMGDGTFCWY